MSTTKQKSETENKVPRSVMMTPSMWKKIEDQADKELRPRQVMLEIMARFYLDHIAEEDIAVVK